MSMDSKTLFAKTSPIKLFFIAALPGMVSMFAASAYSILEGSFIGRYIGGTAFAAVNLAMPLVLINFSLADMIGVGSSVPISISLGQKDEKRANNIFSCSLIMIFLAAILMGIFMFLASPMIMQWMGAEGEAAALAIKYIRVYALCGPFIILVFAMDNFLRISGFIKSSMFLNIFMSLLNITLLFVFIVVLEMGIVGSALATYGVLMYASDIIQPFLYGMNDSLQPAIGFNWGAKAYDRVKGIAKCVFVASAVVSCIGTAVMYFWSTPLASLFVDANEPELLVMASNALKIFCVAYLIRWFGFCAQGFYSAIEKPLQASILSVTSALVFPLIVIVVLWPMSLDGIWLNMFGTSILVAVLAVIMLLQTLKKMKA